MRIILALIIMMLSLCLCAKEEYSIFSLKLNRTITLDELASELVNYDIIFFGEYHDNQIHHKLEAKLLEKLIKLKPGRIAVSMEMFETDVSDIMDAYLDGRLSEKEMITKTRAWPNYLSDYKPVVDIVKVNNLDFISANIPRRIASARRKHGYDFKSFLSPSDTVYVPKNQFVFENEYKELFTEMMKMSMSTHPAMSGLPQGFYEAQCIKDDAMAEQISNFKNSNKNKIVIHYNGDFHSRYGLGTANRVKKLTDNAKIAVIAPVHSFEKEDIYYKELPAGDFLIKINGESDEQNSEDR